MSVPLQPVSNPSTQTQFTFPYFSVLIGKQISTRLEKWEKFEKGNQITNHILEARQNFLTENEWKQAGFYPPLCGAFLSQFQFEKAVHLIQSKVGKSLFDLLQNSKQENHQLCFKNWKRIGFSELSDREKGLFARIWISQCDPELQADLLLDTLKGSKSELIPILLNLVDLKRIPASFHGILWVHACEKNCRELISQLTPLLTEESVEAASLLLREQKDLFAQAENILSLIQKIEGKVWEKSFVKVEA